MGSVLETQADLGRPDEHHRIDQLRDALLSGGYGTLHAGVAAYDYDPDRRCRGGLAWLLTGLRRAHADLVGIDLDIGPAAAQVHEAIGG